MRDKKTITVYWAPAKFNAEKESWNMLYRDPELLFSDISQPSVSGSMKKCPAAKNIMKNTFVFRSNLTDKFDLPGAEALNALSFSNESFSLPVESKIGLFVRRKTSIPEHINVEYNLSWLMFSDEPLLATFTPPYFPAVSPVKSSYLGIGEYDIGQWFRPFNLDYHLPINADSFLIKEDDPLFFVKFHTEKRIVFKRFKYSSSLQALSDEFTFSPDRYGQNRTLKERYRKAKRANMTNIVLHEIRQNLIN